MGVNFTPTLGSYIKPQPLRYWTQPILPLTFDDSLSYMELLSKVAAKLNECIEYINEGSSGGNGIPDYTTENIGQVLGVVENNENNEDDEDGEEVKLQWVNTSGLLLTEIEIEIGSYTYAGLSESYETIQNSIDKGISPVLIIPTALGSELYNIYNCVKVGYSDGAYLVGFRNGNNIFEYVCMNTEDNPIKQLS